LNSGTEAIDLTKWIEEAHQFGNYQDGTAYLIEMHGFGTNDSGVYEEGEVIQLAKSGRSLAKAKLAKTPRGVWLYGYDFSSATWGSASPISVWNRTGYSTRGAAIDACIPEAIRFFEGVARATDSCTSETSKSEARQMIAALSPKEPSPQMGLFDLLAIPPTTAPFEEP